MVDEVEQKWDKKPKHAAPSRQNTQQKKSVPVHRGKHARPSVRDDIKAVPQKGARHQTIQVPKKKRIWLRVLIVVLALVLAVVLAGVAYASWYMSQLDTVLSADQVDTAALDEVLVPAKANEPFYMLIVGSDSREGSGTSNKEAESGTNERSDVMMLARVDAANKQVTLVSIPRDTPYYQEDGTLVKINEAYNIGGIAYSIKAASDVTGAPISYYAAVHFSEFEALIDVLGGITVNVPQQLSYKDALTGEKVTIEPGVQTLNGQQAQIFARSRKTYADDQEGRRQTNNRVLVEGILNKVLSKPLGELPQAVLDVAACVETNMRARDLVDLAIPFALGSSDMKTYSGTGPKTGDFREETGGLWFCYDNPEGWAKVMEVTDSGGDPSTLDVEDLAIKE